MKRYKNKMIVSVVIPFVIALLFGSTSFAQDTNFRLQAWRFGLNLGGQYNSSSLGWQSLHGSDFNFHAPENDIDLVDGDGMGYYIGIFGEYLSRSWWGVELRMSYDVRNALIEDLTHTPIPSFDTKMNYLTISSLFRVDQKIIPNLNFYIGPLVSFNLHGSYEYKPNKDASATEPEVDISGRDITSYGIETGLAYDFRVHDIDANSSMYVSPFVEMSWLVNQRKGVAKLDQNSITDIWSTLSYRIGAKFSWEIREPDPAASAAIQVLPQPVKITVVMPYDNKIYTKNVKGYFPIHPYVFFDKGSSDIPVRYTMLTKAEATNFKEADLENFNKGDLTEKETNVNQLMVTYYNVLNIYGDRMRRYPSEKLTLRASDPEGVDGQFCANAVKSYLVSNYDIDEDRISIEIDSPANPSGTDSTEASSRALINAENRRVTFVFNDPKMTKPLPYTIRDETSIDNDMIFSINKSVPFKSWDLTISGEGKSMYFGPYAYSTARVNPAEIMRFLETGKYTAVVEITDKQGFKSRESMNFQLTKDRELKNASRYLMLFDYGKSDAIKTYEKIIREEITPGIVYGNKVIVHGHTDVIGTDQGNELLSQQRADQAKSIIDDQLIKENRKADVRAIGIGSRKTQYTFDNKYPEGRMYNRNIFVEITP